MMANCNKLAILLDFLSTTNDAHQLLRNLMYRTIPELARILFLAKMLL